MSDPKPLAPTHRLILDLLAARHRLGEPWWTFPQSCGKWLRELSARQLIALNHGVVEHTLRASLTEGGRERALDGNYVPPRPTRLGTGGKWAQPFRVVMPDDPAMWHGVRLPDGRCFISGPAEGSWCTFAVSFDDLELPPGAVTEWREQQPPEDGVDLAPDTRTGQKGQ